MTKRPIQTATDRKHSRAARIAIAAIACIPLIYGGALIWSNQDPTHRLDKIPAAVVDLDQPVMQDGKTIDVGKSVAHELVTDHADNDFDWHETDASSARAGLKNGTYLATITLPKTMSAHAASLGSDEPLDAADSQITITTDDGQNYIVGVAAKTVGLVVSQKAAKGVAQEYLSQIYSGIDEIGGQLGDAVKGAKQVASGAGTLKSGADQLSTGAQQSADGASQLASGLGSLSSGAQTLAGGTAQLSTGTQSLASGAGRLSTGAQTLADGTSRLADGTDQLADGLDTLKSKTDPLASQATQLSSVAGALSSGLTTYSAQVDQAIAMCQNLVNSGQSADPQLTQLCTQISRLGSAEQLAQQASRLSTDAPALLNAIDQADAGANTLATKAHQAATGAQQVAAGAQQTAAGAQALASGAQQTASGAQLLATKTQQAATGASALATGTRQVADGAKQLDSGAGTLASGSSELADKLAKGQASVPSYDDADKKHLSGIAAQPVGLSQSRLNGVPSYGYGLAPYFLALGAWVGGLSIYMILRAIPQRAIDAGRPGWLAALLGYARGAWISLVQAALLYVVVTLGIGVHPQHPAGLALFMGLTSLAFTAVNHTLMVLFGSRGRFLGLILLVLQVAAAGATYPIQTTPGFFQVLHGLLPLTYVANAIRSLIAGGSAGVGVGVTVMVCWMLAALAISVGASAFRHFRKSEILLPDFVV
ncbi:YhgE/Pip domain-containing protein [Gryllotalpicola daejeonensis]|uniref:YhgE/Pip domain-containing protein n=1 Tax=Gryllotalpicola daejeonensis TaxID=993087 RepID=A0ABP7ZND0_9MICO